MRRARYRSIRDQLVGLGVSSICLRRAGHLRRRDPRGDRRAAGAEAVPSRSRPRPALLRRPRRVPSSSEAEAELSAAPASLDDKIETPENYREHVRAAGRRASSTWSAPIPTSSSSAATSSSIAPARSRASMRSLAARRSSSASRMRRSTRPRKKRIAELGGKQTLAVGDGLPTDIRGAVENGVPGALRDRRHPRRRFRPARRSRRRTCRRAARTRRASARSPTCPTLGWERRHDQAKAAANRHASTHMPEAWRGGVMAIGNFDGVHRGHQAVLRRRARGSGAPRRRLPSCSPSSRIRAPSSPAGRCSG